METLGVILFSVGVIIAAVGGIWVVVKAFQESLVWGLCSIFIPLVVLIFVLTHWGDCKKPFGIWAVGVILYIGGFMLSADKMDTSDDTSPALIE